MSTLTASFIGEPFRFADAAAADLFNTVKNRVGKGQLIEAKNGAPGEILTVEILQALAEAAKPQDTRLDVVEDGKLTCSFVHPRGDGEFNAQGWTLDNDGQPVLDRQTNQPIRAGSFFVKSRKAMAEAGLGSVVTRMEALTASITSKPADKRLALVGAVCRFHRKDPRHNVLALIGRTTDKATVLDRLAESEAFYGSAAEASAEGAAVKAARDRKAQRRNGSSGRKDEEYIPFGPARLKAETPVQRKTAEAIVKAFPPDEGGCEKVAGMSGADLVVALKPHGIDLPEHVAEAIVRSVARAVNPPGAATLAESRGADQLRNQSWQPRRKRGTGSRPGNKSRRPRSDSEEE